MSSSSRPSAAPPEAGAADPPANATPAEADYRTLFEAGTCKAEVDLATGRFLRVNDRYCDLTGYSRDELLGGMNFLEITHPDDRQENLEQIGPIRQHGQGSFEIEKRYVRKDGSPVWVHVTVTLIRSAATGQPRLLASAHDITRRREAEEALRVAHDTFRHLVDQSPFGIHVIDADFRLVRLSAGAQRVFETVRPLIGRDFAEVLRCVWPEPFASEAIDRFRHTLATGEPYRAPATVERRRDSGEIESYDWKIERVALPDGRYGVVCHFYDLSERQRYEAALRESEQRFRTMADSSPVMIWVTEPRGKIEFVNRAYLDFFGVTEPDLHERGWQPLVHPDDVDGYTASFQAAVGDRAGFSSECRVRHADGSWRWIASYAAPRFSGDGEFLGHVGSSPDITARKEAEQSLIEADRRKDEFLATLAHELRNPLAPLVTSIDLLDRIGSENPDVVSARTIFRRQLNHLVRLVDDLLDISRITRNQIELRRERVSLDWIIDRALEDSRSLCEGRAHVLQVTRPDQPVWLHADATRLVQVVGNLLANACKYTPPGGRVDLVARTDDDTLEIAVTDNGVGIPPAELPRIFGIFEQVHADRRLSQGGLGIGLSLVKRLVELHGGTVEATSAGPGQGSQFIVRLPIMRAEPSADGHPAADPAGMAPPARQQASPRRVLIVDDNRDSAISLARLLERSGNRTATAHDGPEAIEAARDFDPHLVLLDIGLPTMSGHDVCRALRRERASRAPVIVALTGWGQEEDRRLSDEAGFDHHLVKPIDFNKLRHVLDAIPGDEPVSA